MSYDIDRKLNFRPSEPNQRKGKRRLSSWVWLIIGNLYFSAVALASVTMSPEELEQQVGHSFEQEVATQAKVKRWQNYQLDYQIWLPSSVNHLPQCPQALRINGRDNQVLPIGNLKRAVICESDDTSWRVNITIKAALTLPVVVTQVSMARGEIVSAANLQLISRRLSRQEDFYSAVQDAAGLETTRRIRAGQMVNPHNLSSPPLIEKGNQVLIIASQDGFTATTKGIALEDGKANQQINVRNNSSGKVIKAVVSGRNQVETTF